jgi:protoporphyrinogen oxidase
MITSNIEGRSRKQDIAVLGAGPMGLAVAYQLARDGHHPVIFEADDRLGGMTASFDFGGLLIERYYHFHCISDAAFLHILDELNISDKMRWKPTKMAYWYKNQLQDWGNPIALLRFKGLSFLAKFRYGLHAFLCTKRQNWKPLDAQDAVSWIKRWVGSEAYEVLWRRLFEFKFYEYTNHLSAAWIWSRIRRIGRSRYNLFKEKLGYLEGGSNTLLEALGADIKKHGGEIFLSSPVQKIEISRGKVCGVMVGGQLKPFDQVISTIPLPYVPKIAPDLPPDYLAKWKSIKNIAVVCVIAKLARKVSANFWMNTNDPEMDIPGIVEYSNLRPLNQTIVYVPFYMPGEHPKFADDDSAFIAKVKRYLRRINSELSDDDFVQIHVSRYRFAQPICQPGYLDDLPQAKTAIQGLWIADTSHYYPEDRGISESIGFGRKMAKDATA